MHNNVQPAPVRAARGSHPQRRPQPVGTNSRGGLVPRQTAPSYDRRGASSGLGVLLAKWPGQIPVRTWSGTARPAGRKRLQPGGEIPTSNTFNKWMTADGLVNGFCFPAQGLGQGHKRCPLRRGGHVGGDNETNSTRRVESPMSTFLRWHYPDQVKGSKERLFLVSAIAPLGLLS